MKFRTFVRLVFVLALVVAANAAELHAANQYPIPKVEGLEIIRGDDVIIKGPQGKAIAHKFKDGRISVYGNGRDKSYWSHDGGRTWKEGPEGPPDKMVFEFDDGEILSVKRDLIPRPDGKFTVRYWRSTDGWKTVNPAEGIAEVPLATSTGSDDAVNRVPSMMMHHGIVQLKDGTLLATLYGNYKGDRIFCEAYPIETGVIKRRVVTITSKDRGKTWEDPTHVAYDTMLGVLNEPDITGNQLVACPAVTQEGFTEPDLTIAPNGDIICVMRSGGAVGAGIIPTWPTPLYMSRSTDNGKSWSTPVQIADRGVCPNLITLENGIIVCSYSRPGAWLIFSDDNGQTWKGATQFGPNNNYVYIADVGPDTVQTYREGPNHSVIATYFTVRKINSETAGSN
jgi:hypothetical protein